MTIEKILKETKNLVLDTSVIIGYLMEENLSIITLLDTYVFNKTSNLTLYGHNLLKAEIYYVICRIKGMNEAKNILSNLERIISTIGESWLFEKAGQIKCKYPIAFSDCFSLALAHFQDCPIFFLRERELSKEIISQINKDFNIKIYIVS